LRGIAALIVVFEHISALLPVGNWTVGRGLTGSFTTSLANIPFRSGAFAVYVFFVISGVVIAQAAINKPWPLSLVSRYLRLTIPMLAASLMAWLLLRNFPYAMPTIRQFKDNHWTSEDYQTGPASFLDAISEPIFRVYRSAAPTLNPVLWTMRMEMFGSLAILSFYRFVPARMRLAGAILIALALAMSGHWRYLAFPLGAAIFEINARNPIGWRPAFGLWAIFLGLGLDVVGGMPQMHGSDLSMSRFFGVPVDLTSLIYTAGAALTVVGVMANTDSKRILEMRIPQFLGRISYCLYLTHMPLLFTAFAALYLELGHPPTPLWLVGWTLFFAVVALAVAWWFTLWIDEPITRLVKVRKRRDAIEIAPTL